MVSRNLKHFAILVCLCCLFSVASAAELVVRFDRAEFSIDEAFELSISSNNATSGNIDLGQLQQNFEILDQYKQSSVRIINGDMTQSTTWTYRLVAKQSGKLTIPAITVGNATTKAREIIVKESVAQGRQNNDIIVEAEIEQTSAYVQQQIIYTQRLLFAKPFRNDATLTRPSLKEGRADVESLGNTPERIVTRNGRDYRQLTRRFAIIPQASGSLVFAPSMFSGTMRGSSQRLSNNRFGFSSRARRVRVGSKEISIEIKPRPTAFTGKDWIIANDFSLHLNWSTPPTQIEAGKPVSVVLAAIANGLRAEQLPEINLQAPAGIKFYPEKPSFTNERNLDGIIGTMNKRIVVVPTGGGVFEIPALRISWWNSKTNQEEEAVLAAVKLNVSGEPIAITQQVVATPDVNTAQKETVASVDQRKLSTTVITLLILVGILLVLFFGWLLMRWKALQQLGNASEKHLAEKQQIVKTLEHACITNNAAEAQRQLHYWMQSIEKSPAQLFSRPLQQQIKQLHHALYAKEKENWQGKALWQAVESYQKQLDKGVVEQDKKRREGLEPLYY
jgi:hypothetical protein